jgi:hypothetical protein
MAAQIVVARTTDLKGGDVAGVRRSPGSVQRLLWLTRTRRERERRRGRFGRYLYRETDTGPKGQESITQGFNEDEHDGGAREDQKSLSGKVYPVSV